MFSFLRFKNFISASIKYAINLIFSVRVCICKINVLNGGDSMLNHTKYLDDVTLTSFFFLIFTSARYHRDMNALKILASNSKHFRIYSIYSKLVCLRWHFKYYFFFNKLSFKQPLVLKIQQIYVFWLMKFKNDAKIALKRTGFWL